jgi:hypothetical protein
VAAHEVVGALVGSAGGRQHLAGRPARRPRRSVRERGAGARGLPAAAARRARPRGRVRALLPARGGARRRRPAGARGRRSRPPSRSPRPSSTRSPASSRWCRAGSDARGRRVAPPAPAAPIRGRPVAAHITRSADTSSSPPATRAAVGRTAGPGACRTPPPTAPRRPPPRAHRASRPRSWSPPTGRAAGSRAD